MPNYDDTARVFIEGTGHKRQGNFNVYTHCAYSYDMQVAIANRERTRFEVNMRITSQTTTAQRNSIIRGLEQRGFTKTGKPFAAAGDPWQAYEKGTL